jgi:L-fuculose-phosphate aldolase
MNPYTRKPESEHRADIVEVCRRIYAKGFAAASDGNVSVRLGPDRILATPSGLSKGYMTPEQLIVTDLEGCRLPPFTAANRDLRPSSEIKMHLEAYRQRPDIGAVVHAHPPVATACTLAGVSLARCVLPEVVLTLVAIPTADYATPSTNEVPLSIRDLIRDYDALLLERHGALTVGKDVYDAYFKLEKVEHTAEITLAARQLGRVRGMASEEVRKIEALRQQMGLSRQGIDPRTCQECRVCGQGGRQRRRERESRRER